MAFVIVREGCALPPLQGQTRLVPVERLDLAFLVDEDHCRVAWRVHVEIDDIIELGGEVGSLDRLKVLIRCGWSLWAAHMRWIVRSERPIALAMARPVQWVTAPRGAQGALDDGMHLACGTRRSPADRSCRAATLNAFLGEALLPAPHHRPADADPLGNLQHRQALGGRQDRFAHAERASPEPSVLDDPL